MLVEVALKRGMGLIKSRRHRRAATPSEKRERTNWPQIAALYGLLLRLQPTPVVELNRAVAIGMAAGPAAGLALIDGIDTRRATRATTS